MTYDQDPARWSTDPDEAPELLRGAFAAGRTEAPNRSQMRSLAVKLAAASAGGAVAVGTVKAASAGNTIATAATWSAAKVAGVIALAGSVVAGAVVWNGFETTPRDHTKAPVHATQRSGTESTAEPTSASAPGAATGSGPVRSGSTAQHGATSAAVASVPGGAANTPTVESIEAAGAPTEVRGTAGAEGRASTTNMRGAQPSASLTKAEPRRRSASKAADRSRGARSTRSDDSGSARSVSSAGATQAPPSEVSLLRSAQVALQSRPREAFQLTQQHRRLYPAGEFAQERDALAIQALMRAGDSELARELAQAFIRAYPSSPHAHRFREAMGIR